MCITLFSDLKMPISWKQLIGDCSKLSNCKIVCGGRRIIESHKVVLGSISPFLRSIISDIPTGDEITFFMPDFDHESVDEFLGAITLNKTPTNTDLLRAFGYEISKVTRLKVKSGKIFGLK